MSVISIFNGVCCNEDRAVQAIAEALGLNVITDERVAADAAEMSNVPASKIMRAFSSKISVFNRFTHEKECAVAHLKLALAQLLMQDDLLIAGFSGLLIPQALSHVLRLCLIANMDYRVRSALENRGIQEKEALRWIRKTDEARAAWTRLLFEQPDPWSGALYDIVIPAHDTTLEKMVGLVRENADRQILQYTDASRQAALDFLLAARTGVLLSKSGHDVAVSASNGNIVLTINKQVLRLNRLSGELKEIAGRIEGVKSVETRIGKGFHQSDIYRKHDFSVPSRVLLVDDEREFVQTLSERLLLRDMGAATVFDGESALKMIRDDEPDVMIIDLKMPGIDGFEVLKQVKAERPGIEVIVLTGHGSEEDRKQCMALGAFAYLQKPVDIELLSVTLKKAHEKMHSGREMSECKRCP